MEHTKAKPRSRLGLNLLRRREWVLFISTLVLNSGLTARLTKGLVCLGLNCHACPLAVMSCPIGVMQHFVGQGRVPWYVIGVIGLAGAWGGRFACGWLCPFGWLQEWIYRLPVPKWPVQPRRPARWWVLLLTTVFYAAGFWLVSAWSGGEPVLVGLYLVLGFALYALLGAGRVFALVGIVLVVALATAETWFCKLCPAGLLEGGLPWVLLDPNLRPLIGGLYGLKLAILASFLVWMAVTRRPFCRWICPLGAFWSPFNRWSTLQIVVDGETCIRCNRCQQRCPVDIPIYQDPNSGACIRCLRCVNDCPVGCVSVRARQGS